MPKLTEETGAALFVALYILVILTFLGVFALGTSITEIYIAGSHKAEVAALYLAEAGIEQVLYWFNNPSFFNDAGNFPNGYSGPPVEFFKKRKLNGTSYIDVSGSQFAGTSSQPDLEYKSPEDDLFLNDRTSGLFRNLQDVGKISNLKIYGPSGPGLICTIEATGITASGAKKTISVELAPSPLSPITAGIQSGQGGIGPGADPFLVHWGDARIKWSANLGSDLANIPKKNLSIPIDNAPYSLIKTEDNWIDIYVEGTAYVGSGISDGDTQPYDQSPPNEPGHGNIYQNQSNLALDLWDYNRIKNYAKEYGLYYTTDANGNIYLNGGGSPFTLNQVLSSSYTGDSKGLVFIDTIDGDPPNPAGSNLANLSPGQINYSEGLFYIAANINVNGNGAGLTLSAASPPYDLSLFDPTTSIDEGKRVAINISGINLKGMLYSPGRIGITGDMAIYGSMVAERGFTGIGKIEVWYNYDYTTGSFPGQPAILKAKGTWHEEY